MPTLLLLCLLGLLSCLATESAPVYLSHYCPNTTTFNPNSSYETNLNFVISSLSSNATRDTGFYNVTAGRTPPDVAYGLFLCRGDVTSQVCQDCVATAVNETVRRRCRGFKQAIIWYDECMLRYTNESFFSQVSEGPRVAMYNTQNITEQNQFNQVLEDTLSAIRTQAVNDLSGKKFATKEANFTGFQTVYSLVQCTPDLSPGQCDRCLIGTIAILPDCCGGSQGARVLFPSCNVRYELYPFYRSVAAPPPPPQAPPLEPSTKGKLPVRNSGPSPFLFLSSQSDSCGFLHNIASFRMMLPLIEIVVEAKINSMSWYSF